jgi:cellulose synthase/poly-beta-1,6-N-acetylglucosamine synthase-like glycosyltransferase
VDDGSAPPLSLPSDVPARMVRTSGVERSRARNAGAATARGELLIFIDDDISVGPSFVQEHVRAAVEFGPVISVGKISPPPESSSTAFGRFRHTIESPGLSRPRGLVPETNFCTAANMSMRRRDFLELGGFDPAILSGEDQDLALRFSQGGGRIAYIPEAEVIHRDAIADVVAYCRRHEWGGRTMAPLIRRYPDRSENVVRRQLVATLRESRFPGGTFGLVARMILSSEPSLKVVEWGVRGVERLGFNDRQLFPLYRLLLGLRLFRGYREGLARVRQAPAVPASLDPAGRDPETD